MTKTLLTTQQLNRTLLHRHHLLECSSMSTGDMLRAIAGLQAQDVKDPYSALWSRIAGFRHEDLAGMLTNREAVRASLMRGTIHLATRDDYAMFFPATYPLHERAVSSIFAAKLVPSELHAEICDQAIVLLRDKPQTTAELGVALAETWPDYDPKSLGTVVRFLLPLVQATPRGV